MSEGGVNAEQDALVRVAGRALARADLVHAYGHCSIRLDDRRFLVTAARPLGLLTGRDTGVVVDIRRDLPPGVLGEVRMHQQVYAARPDVGGVCRVQPRHVMALSALGRVPRPRHGFGSYFWPQPAFWEDIQLVRDDATARAVAQQLADASAVVLRGNGAVVVGATVQRAVVLSWFLEDAARIELEALRTAPHVEGQLLDEHECRQRATWSGGLEERMWEYLTAGEEPGGSWTPGAVGRYDR